MTARPAPTSGAGFGQVAARPGSAGAGPLPTGAAGAGRAAAPAGRSPTGGARQPPAGNGDDREAERGLRGLVGSGSSQVGVGAAIRARDAARPTEAHLAEAEERLVIVRRNWAPREDLPRR